MPGNVYCQLGNKLRKLSINKLNMLYCQILKVISVSPLKLQYGATELYSSNLYIEEDLSLQANDEVAVIPLAGGQKFIILCKVKKL